MDSGNFLFLHNNAEIFTVGRCVVVRHSLPIVQNGAVYGAVWLNLFVVIRKVFFVALDLIHGRPPI